jgi:two-component system sensor histidine kinase KdpD
MINDFSRPDPEDLLEQLQADHLRQSRGRLKVFLGYAAGVGKTFAMLEAAHQRIADGIDVVAGYVETHGRAETEALLDHLEIIPRRSEEYHGALLSEMDVDAILARRPALVLVDELAHSNTPASRHPKRFQDVEDLLNNNIDVYTTLNIQHLESLNDVVQQITGVKVRETIPDRILEEADDIEVIDLPPQELIARLKAGKVYLPEQAARASRMFFRKGNLTALREIALRHAAARVDSQMLDYMEAKSIHGPWPAHERILVAISANPLSERLVRAGRRMADNFNAEWTVIYVETPERNKFSLQKNENIARTLNLAEQLGAQVITLSGTNVQATLLDYAHKHNITKIIAGKPIRPRWHESLHVSIVDEIIREGGPIDVYVISDRQNTAPVILPHIQTSASLRQYIFSVLIILLITLISLPFQKLFHPVNLVMLYLAGVVVSALYLGRGPSMLAAFIGVLAFDFFFIDPRLTFSVYDTQYILTFISLLVVGLVISNLTARVKDQVEVLQKRQEQTHTLYSLSRDLTTAIGLETLLQTVIQHVGQTLGRKVAIFLPQNEQLVISAASPDFEQDLHEIAIATWAFEHGQPTGRGTETLPAADVRYQPLTTNRGTLGILAVRPDDSNNYLNPEQRQLLEAYASLAAVAIERVMLDQEASQAQVLRESERLQSALLNSISHDLRTPLASISGALDSLYETEQNEKDSVHLDRSAKLDLLETAREESNRLNRLVGNLLEMTRVEAGALRLNRTETDLQELISSALSHSGDRLSNHPVHVQIPENMPAVNLDYILIEQVILNILDNAIKYSQTGTPIDISVQSAQDHVEIAIADRGAGIPPENLIRVFDKFFRIEQTGSVHGTGLGLSICKGIVEAHDGQIWAKNRTGGGAIITFTLPAKKSSLTEGGI